MNKIQNEHWIDALPGEAVQVANDINIEIAKVIAQRIKKIGELSPSDIKKLSNSLQYLGADFQKITQLIAKYSQKGQTAIVDMLKKAADASDEFANIFYSSKGIAAHTWRNDAYLNSLVEAMARQTVAHFTNLSNTLAYRIDDRTLPLRQMYMQAVDKAIYEVHSGTTDYYTAMRKTIRQLSSDMRVVKWESGYVRRIDSHIRQNMLDGVKQLNQQMMNYHGAKFGADGIELSAHAICAPDHLPAQGRQFSNEEFEKMQSQQPFEDVNGAQYSAFQRPIGEWNCRHFAFPIIIGISEPAYTEEQLKQYADNSTTKYEATQVQRAMETKLRKLKNQRLVQSAAGDELGAKQTQRKINELQTKYRKFSEKNNIAYQPKRATVEGYRRISIKDLQDLENRDILKKKIEKGTLSLTINPEKQSRHILGDKYVAGRSYVTISIDELQELVNNNFATGKVYITNNGNQIHEIIICDKEIGVSINNETNMHSNTKIVKVHYSKTGTHVVPTMAEVTK